MRIVTNSIGNYSPNSVNQSRAIKGQRQVAQQKVEDLTKNEKKFFTGLYPDQSGEVMDYHFYQRTGKMGGVKLGSLFDRKG